MTDINSDNQIQNKKNRQSVNKKAKYSIVTVVLLVCIVQLGCSVFCNINKTVSFRQKKAGLENKRNEELNKNLQLKSELENFNSDAVLESIARNNLKMAGENEILIIINKPQEEMSEESTDKNIKKSNKKPKSRQ